MLQIVIQGFGFESRLKLTHLREPSNFYDSCGELKSNRIPQAFSDVYNVGKILCKVM